MGIKFKTMINPIKIKKAILLYLKNSNIRPGISNDAFITFSDNEYCISIDNGELLCFTSNDEENIESNCRESLKSLYESIEDKVVVDGTLFLYNNDTYVYDNKGCIRLSDNIESLINIGKVEEKVKYTFNGGNDDEYLTLYGTDKGWLIDFRSNSTDPEKNLKDAESVIARAFPYAIKVKSDEVN